MMNLCNSISKPYECGVLISLGFQKVGITVALSFKAVSIKETAFRRHFSSNNK